MTSPTKNLGTSKWCASRGSQLNLVSSNAQTDIIALTLPAASALAGRGLVIGSTFRITLRGTVQTQATSGTLTFRFYMGANVAAQTAVMASQVAAGPVPFWLQADMVIRSIGASGTYVCNIGGWISFTTRVFLENTGATGASTAVVNTTLANPIIKATAQWATSSATNRLLVENANIEQVA